MIVQNEDSNGSYRSSSQLELIPSSQIHKAQKQPTARAVSKTTAQKSRATKADKKLRTFLVVDASVMSGVLGDDVQTVFNNYLFGDHSDQNNNTASAESQPYEFCMVNSLSVPVFRWTKYNLHLLPEDKMFDYTVIPEYEPFVLVVLENEVFLDLVCASADGISFGQLSKYMRMLFGDSVDSMDVCDDDDVSVSNVVALVDLEKSILKAQRKLNKTSNGSQRSVSDLVDSAASCLLYEHNIELFRCKKSSEFAEYLHTLTRLIDNRVVEVVTEIDCVAKAQREKLPEGLSLKEQEAFDIRQTWSSMLQMLPLMSRDKALALIASSPDCSCPRSLFEYYCNSSSGGSSSGAGGGAGAGNDGSGGSSAPLTAQQRMLLLQNSFGAGKNGAPKNQAKLSKLVYHMITATEPEGLINKFT